MEKKASREKAQWIYEDQQNAQDKEVWEMDVYLLFTLIKKQD